MVESNKSELPEWLKWVFWIGVIAAMAIGMYQYQRMRTPQDDQAIELINDELRRSRGEAEATLQRDLIEHPKFNSE